MHEFLQLVSGSRQETEDIDILLFQTMSVYAVKTMWSDHILSEEIKIFFF